MFKLAAQSQVTLQMPEYASKHTMRWPQSLKIGRVAAGRTSSIIMPQVALA